MEKNLYIDASHPDETRIVLKSNDHIEEYEYENKNKLYLKNNIYLGKVSRIEPSLQAAFVNYGKQRHGFLAFNDIQSDYYQIPHDDKERLKKEEETDLISIAMEEFGSKFKGIELAVIDPETKDQSGMKKVRSNFFGFLLGDRQGLTIIGPASIVKEIKKDPDKIELLTKEARKGKKK